jgi:Glycosyl hydrolases family 38 N-terminal domain/Alpha mannosidase middle domain
MWALLCLLRFVSSVVIANAKDNGWIRKFNAVKNASDFRALLQRDVDIESTSTVLNIHLVPHSHDDVGWLKTVDQYYGPGPRNTSIDGRGNVHSIISTVVAALMAHPMRTFCITEIKYLTMWYYDTMHTTQLQRDDLHYLVNNQQIQFVNGGWVMHDEATTHVMGMIDQTTLGHLWISQIFGPEHNPVVGWQLDPFGHSASQAKYLSSDTGFQALYFGRIDYQDMQRRQLERQCEGLWSVTKSSNDTSTPPLFWGLTGSYQGNYGAPAGFCFDTSCSDSEQLISGDGSNDNEDEETRLLRRLRTFLEEVRVQVDQTATNSHHVMLTMGSDFQYEYAHRNYANLDLLIDALMNYQRIRDPRLPVSTILGPTHDAVNIFYSTPAYYTECKHAEYIESLEKRELHLRQDADVNSLSIETNVNPMKLLRTAESRRISTTKEGRIHYETKSSQDDFFPYADCPHCYWTGYFTSRTALKRYERVASNLLMICRQLDVQYTLLGKRLRQSNEASTKMQPREMIETTSRRKRNDLEAVRSLYEMSTSSGLPLFALEDAVGVVQHHDGVSGTSMQHVANDYSARLARGIHTAVKYIIDQMLSHQSLGVGFFSEIKSTYRNLMDTGGTADAKLDNLIYCPLLNETLCPLSEVRSSFYTRSLSLNFEIASAR